MPCPPTLGSFRGPGRKDDPCPYANLAMLKALSALEEWRDGDACRTGAETLLSLWSESTTRHPYMFYMGTDFRKLKVPLVWYDLVHVLDVLSRFPWLHTDPRLLDMLAVLKQNAERRRPLHGRVRLDRLERLGVWPEAYPLALVDPDRLAHYPAH